MVGKAIGVLAFGSLIALIWVLLWTAKFAVWAVICAALLFLAIGAFATFDSSEWRRRQS